MNCALLRLQASIRSRATIIIVLATLSVLITAAEPMGPHAQRFGFGAVSASIDEIPQDSILRQNVDGLTPTARAAALRQLVGIPIHDVESLRADPVGRLFYVCHVAADKATVADVVAAPASMGAAVAIALQPSNHSKSGSSNKIFLDFRGGVVTGTSWNTGGTPGHPTAGYPSKNSWTCLPYDTDGDTATFSDTEQAAIFTIYQRVAEAYATFDVDVTTDPATPVGASLGTQTSWVFITQDTDQSGAHLPHFGAGGIAYLGYFGTVNNASGSPAWVASKWTDSNSVVHSVYVDNIADAAAHEVGHNLNLNHDGNALIPGDEEYYWGFATNGTVPSWGPIMGAAYYSILTQWSKGEYNGATNTEDDLAKIASKLTRLTTPTTTAVNVAGTSFSAPSDHCLLCQSTDTNQFIITCVAPSSISATVAPTRTLASGVSSGTLYASLALKSGSTTLATAAPTVSANPTINNVLVSPGTYTLVVAPVSAGDPMTNPPSGFTSYGSIGTYSLNGTIIAGHVAITGLNSVAIAAGDTTPSTNDGTDFGRVFSGSASSPTIFSLTNDGSAALTLGTITWSDHTNFDLTTTVVNGMPINPGDSAQTISITYHAPTSGTTQQTTVTIPISGGISATFVVQGSVGRLPVVIGPSSVSGTVGAALTATMTVVTDRATSYQTQDLPPGVSVSNSGFISGTPTQTGSWSASITPVNEFGAGTTVVVPFTIAPVPPPPPVIFPSGGGGGGGLCGLGSGIAGLLVGLSLILRHRSR